MSLALSVLLLLYIISFIVIIFLYNYAPKDFEELNLDNLEINQRKEVLKFIYDSALAHLSMYHESLIGCLFGVFVIFALLFSTELPAYIKFPLLWLGIIADGLTILILGYTMGSYSFLLVVEKTYKIGNNNKAMQDYSKEGWGKALTVLKRFPIIGWRAHTPKQVIIILGAFWLMFLLPIMCLMIMMCFPL